MYYRDANLSDCDSIVEIHLQSFNNFFLTSLGKRFLRTFYKSCIKSNETVSVVCYDESDEMLGFAMGSTKAEGFYKRLLLNNIPAFSLEAIRLLFTKPGALVRLTYNLTKSGESESDIDHAELLSIATLPEAKGQGIGKQLIEAFESRLRERGSNLVSLTTDYYDNDSVVGFYIKSGYTIENDFVAYPERRMYRMIKHL